MNINDPINANCTQNGQGNTAADTNHEKQVPRNQTVEQVKYAACVVIGALVLAPLSAVTAGGVMMGALVTETGTENALGTLFKAWVSGEKTLGQCWNQATEREKVQLVASAALAALVTAIFSAAGVTLMIVVTPLPALFAVTAAVMGALGLAAGGMIGHRLYSAAHNA